VASGWKNCRRGPAFEKWARRKSRITISTTIASSRTSIHPAPALGERRSEQAAIGPIVPHGWQIPHAMKRMPVCRLQEVKAPPSAGAALDAGREDRLSGKQRISQ
jgi:hypothetical protein